MNRRSFLGILAGLVASVAAPFKAKASAAITPQQFTLDSVITKLVPVGDDLLVFGSDHEVWVYDGKMKDFKEVTFVGHRVRYLNGKTP